MVAALSLGMLAPLAACGSASSGSIPRTLGGSVVRGAFVPPGAYEAYIRGELLLAQGRPREAVAQFELATTAPDEDAYLLSRLAYAELLADQRASSLRTLAQAAALDPCSEAVWLTRGAIAEHDDDLAAARAAYRHASACAPRSAKSELALAELLAERGAHAAALDVLVHAAARPYGTRVEPALQRSLQQADAATLAHALDTLGLVRAPSSRVLERALRLALERRLPQLAQRMAEAHAASLPPELEAELLVAQGARESLASLLARHDADDFGGHRRTAKLALQAGAYERAELEATSALLEAPSDELRSVRARAALAQGRGAPALADIANIVDPVLRRRLLGEALAQAGAPKLAAELTTVQ